MSRSWSGEETKGLVRDSENAFADCRSRLVDWRGECRRRRLPKNKGGGDTIHTDMTVLARMILNITEQ